MAKFWNSVVKLIQCVETYCCSFEKPPKNSKNNPFCWHDWRCRNNIKKTFLLTAASLFGFTGKNEKIKTTDSVEEVLHNVALATMALKDGNLQKSEKMFMNTLDLAETNNFFSTVVSACDILSSVALKLGDYEKAEDFLIRALNKLLSQGAPEDHNSVIGFNLKLSKLYSKNGNDSLAEMGFRNCLNLQNEKIQNGKEDQDSLLLWATILYWYGKFLVRKNRYQEAKVCFQDICRASSKIEKLSPRQMTVIWYNLGEACRLLGEHDDATEHFLKGMTLAEKYESSDLAHFFSKLGEVSLNKKSYKEARVWCGEAHKLAVRDRNHEAEIESLECLEKLNRLLIS